ncbi:MAG: hypothetical protein AAGG02_04185 [Cyanobacteria bacterium P01_H01_bin.15]
MSPLRQRSALLYGDPNALDGTPYKACIALHSIHPSSNGNGRIALSCSPQSTALPVYELVSQAITEQGPIEIAVLACEPLQILDAAQECLSNGIQELIIITTGVPPLDMVQLLAIAERSKATVLGPGGGLIIPGRAWFGPKDPVCYLPGNIAILGRSPALCDRVAKYLVQQSHGISVAIALGDEGILGSNYVSWLQRLQDEPITEKIVLAGISTEIAEVEAAHYLKTGFSKPVIVYLVGAQEQFPCNFQTAQAIATQRLRANSLVPLAKPNALQAFQEAGYNPQTRLAALSQFL